MRSFLLVASFLTLPILYSCLPRCQKYAIKLPEREVPKPKEPADPVPDTVPPIKRGIEGIGKVGRPDFRREPVVFAEEKKTSQSPPNRYYPFKNCQVRYKHFHCGIAKIDSALGRPSMANCRRFRGVPYTRRQHLQAPDKFRTFPKPKRPKIQRDNQAADTKSPPKKIHIRIEKPK